MEMPGEEVNSWCTVGAKGLQGSVLSGTLLAKGCHAVGFVGRGGQVLGISKGLVLSCEGERSGGACAAGRTGLSLVCRGNRFRAPAVCTALCSGASEPHKRVSLPWGSGCSVNRSLVKPDAVKTEERVRQVRRVL